MSNSPNIVILAKYYKPFYDDNPKNAGFKERRQFYSSNKADGNDYLKYCDTGSKSGKYYEDYLHYSGFEEKSSGAFGEDGLLTFEQKQTLRKDLRATKSVIHDIVISFKEDYGKEHMKTWNDAQELICKELPPLLKYNYIDPGNVNWFAALHENTDNRHIHLCFFEKQPLLTKANKDGLFFHNGKLTKKSLERCKVLMEEHLNSTLYAVDKHRKSLIGLEKETLDNLTLNRYSTLKFKLVDLFRYFDKDSFSWDGDDFYSKKVKEDLFFATRALMKLNPDFENEYKATRDAIAEKDKDIKRICKSQKIDAEPYLLAEKYTQDFYRRIGNVILKYVSNYIYRESIESKSFLAQRTIRNIEKNRRKMMLTHTEFLMNSADREAFEMFEEYQRKLKRAEYEIQKENEMYEE